MKKITKILSFTDFLNEGVVSAMRSTLNETDIFKKGLDFTKNIKKTDDSKPEWKHMPCYEYVFKFINEFKKGAGTGSGADTPTIISGSDVKQTVISSSILYDLKMGYKKDISSLSNIEGLKLAKDVLKVPSMPETMRGLEYVNNKYKLGTIVPVDQAKVGDAINFWVFEFIEFSRNAKEGDMGYPSFPDTKVKLDQYVKDNKLDINKLPVWLIEGITIKYGHYAIISAIDDKYLYLSSSGEKRGCNGIWNGVPKSECSENFTKVLKSDLKKFQNISYDKLLFQSTDTLSNKRTQLILRSYILNFI
jgi:hypothetical protein